MWSWAAPPSLLPTTTAPSVSHVHIPPPTTALYPPIPRPTRQRSPPLILCSPSRQHPAHLVDTAAKKENNITCLPTTAQTRRVCQSSLPSSSPRLPPFGSLLPTHPSIHLQPTIYTRSYYPPFTSRHVLAYSVMLTLTKITRLPLNHPPAFPYLTNHNTN